MLSLQLLHFYLHRGRFEISEMLSLLFQRTDLRLTHRLHSVAVLALQTLHFHLSSRFKISELLFLLFQRTSLRLVQRFSRHGQIFTVVRLQCFNGGRMFLLPRLLQLLFSHQQFCRPCISRFLQLHFRIGAVQHCQVFDRSCMFLLELRGDCFALGTLCFFQTLHLPKNLLTMLGIEVADLVSVLDRETFTLGIKDKLVLLLQPPLLLFHVFRMRCYELRSVND